MYLQWNMKKATFFKSINFYHFRLSTFGLNSLNLTISKNKTPRNTAFQTLQDDFSSNFTHAAFHDMLFVIFEWLKVALARHICWALFCQRISFFSFSFRFFQFFKKKFFVHQISHTFVTLNSINLYTKSFVNQLKTKID